MKKPSYLSLIMLAVFVVADANSVYAQPADASSEIDATVRKYYASMKSRDVEGLRNAVASRFIAVEAGRDRAKSQVVDANNPKELLPPEGNKDWQNIKLSPVVSQVSPTHPTVATASFTLTMPLDEKRVAGLKTALKERGQEFDEARRTAVSRMIEDRAIKNEMFAVLARQEEGWRIVCLSFPR